MLSNTVSGRVGLAFVGLGVVLFALVILEGLTSSFVDIGYCANANCVSIYDYSPLYLPSFYGAVLFSIGTIIVFLTGARANEPEESGSGRTIVLLLSYGAVPVCVFLLLLSNANLNAVHLSTWIGSPVPYVGGCLASLILGPIPLTPCYSLIWEGFWIDIVFYTAWGYAIIILTSLIPRLKPPHLAFPELEDIKETKPATKSLHFNRTADQSSERLWAATLFSSLRDIRRSFSSNRLPFPTRSNILDPENSQGY